MEEEDDELAERRENEMEALKAIFNADLVDLRETDKWRIQRPPELKIHLLPTNSSRGFQQSQCSIDLKLKMTNLYPKAAPEISVAQSNGLSQIQLDLLLEQLNTLADAQKGQEMLFELCMETQAFLAANGGKVFSSFHEEMEERRRAEQSKKSEGHDRLASLDRQAIAEEVILRQKEIELEEKKVKEEAKVKSLLKISDDIVIHSTKEDIPRSKDDILRAKKISECEQLNEGTQRVKFNCRGTSLEVVRGSQLGSNCLGGSTYSGIVLETGQMVAVHRWVVKTGCLNRRERVLDSDSDLAKQINNIENETASLQRVRHQNLVGYLGMEKTEVMVKEKKIVINLIQEFCRGSTLNTFIAGGQKIDLNCFKSLATQVLLGLEHLHSLDIVHRNLSHSSVFVLPDGTAKVADASIGLKVVELVSVANSVTLEDVYPPSLGRGGKKCDIYRLGLVLISVLEGSVVKDQIPKLPGGIPDSLHDFLAKCLMRDERERWSADQLNEHTFIKDYLEVWQPVSAEDSSHIDQQRSQSPEPRAEVAKEPIIIDSSKQSRLNQDFTIISWIGRGGFGDVIQVKNKLDDQTYAIKRIRLNPADRHTNRKIMREVKLLSRLNHENVVRYYNTWQEVTLVSPETGEEDSTTTEETTSKMSRVGGNSLSMLGFQLQAPSFRSPGPGAGEESEWSVSFMPPESDSDSDSDSESYSNIPKYSQDSESEGIVFGTPEAGIEDSAQPKDNQQAREKRIVELNTLYIQMEYCEKKTLRNYIDEGLYKDSKKVWTMFREIIDGLVHIHTQGMIHRDLKPVNIFIDSHGHIKIGDFGLATTELLGTGPTEDFRRDELEENIIVEDDMTGLVGTALYTAPEVAKRNTTYNQKVDLYSLGVIFFEMCHHPLNTGMERIQVLTELRSVEVVFPEDWDSTLLRQQTYIVTWLLDHDPLKRPTSHELLLSDYLPPPLIEESRIEETVRNAMKSKKSKAYRHLISSCMSQPMSLPKDVHFDADTVKQSAVRKLGAAYSFFRTTAEQVFSRHGGVPLDSHLLLPVNQTNPWRHTDTAVQMMTRSGDVVSLPHDLRIPFARYLARLKLNNFKRFTFGKVVKEKKVFGLHPKEYTECGFDIVTGQSGQVLADAELLVVCQEIIYSLGDWEDTKFILRLGHGDLVKGILLHLSVPAKHHSQVVEIIKSFSGSRAETTGRLQSLGVTDSGIGLLLNLLESDTGLNQLTGTLRAVTSRRGEAAELVKSALSELKNIHASAVRLGLQLEAHFSVRSLYPPELYSGMVLQLIRVLPRKTTHVMDIVGAGGRFNSLVARYSEYLDLGVQDKGQVNEEEICATGFSLSVDRLVSAISKRSSFNPALCQVVVAGDTSEQAHLCSEFWKNGVRTGVSPTDRMDELTELARELGAEIAIFATPEHARVSYGDKEGRFLAEKKIGLGEVVNLVTRDLLKVGVEGEVGVGSYTTKSSKDDRVNSGPMVVFNFNFLDRDKYSQSKKKMEVRKSEKLAAALARFDCSCEVMVIALGLPGPVLKSMAVGLDLEDEDKFETSVSELVKLFPRYRKYFVEVCGEITAARFGGKGSPSFVFFSLDDNSFKILH